MSHEFKPPQVQVYETSYGHFRVRAGKITLSITQALDLAFRLHAAAMKAAAMPRNEAEAEAPLGCVCRLSNAGHIMWDTTCDVHGEMAEHFARVAAAKSGVLE